MNLRSALLFMAILLSQIFDSAMVNALTLYMAGDSTMAIKDPKDYPETGWGVPFAQFFDERLSIQNHAQNGRSTRTFLSEGRWQNIVSALQPGDLVFIQFGHNDEVEEKKDRYTTPAQFSKNLRRFIQDVREKKASPILFTPVSRRYFNPDGTVKETHPYSPLVREVAKETGVTFIDLDTLSRAYLQNLGDDASALRFMHIPPNLHPNYPNGVRDNTHFNELGAREIAQIVLQELRARHHPLAQLTRTPDPKHLTFRY